MKIFLGDLIHDWEKVSLWMFPLNVGYIGAYAKKHFPEADIRIFKRPQQMLDAIRNDTPDVVGLSYYVWNTHLNHFVASRAKVHSPDILTVGGGPVFTDLNRTPSDARTFFESAENLDAFVFNQGELGFVELLKAFQAHQGNLDSLRRDMVPGVMIDSRLSGDARATIGDPLSVIRDLDEIPSPYLTGLLDPFFDEPFVPLLETNRSCPYRCTFCAWGIGTDKLARFGDDRIHAEIDYIAQRCGKSANMMVADANFSILGRDEAIAAHIKSCHDKFGFPNHVSVQWNKTRPDRVLKVAKAMGGLAEVGASMQSLNTDVLDAIKRRNLSLDTVVDMIRALKDDQIETPLFSELIVGLPNETRKSHLDANRALMDVGAEIFNYNLHLLPGTEMNTRETREKHFKATGWRLHDNAFGLYDGQKIFEGQEVVLATTAMPQEDLRGFRFIHFLIQFMWSRKWYFDYLKLFDQIGVHPIDVIVAVAESFETADGEMGALFERFKGDHAKENFETFEDLAAYWSEPAHFEQLRSGTYGKLNYQYTFEILLNHYAAFNDFLLSVAGKIFKAAPVTEPSDFMDQVSDVVAFCRARRVTLSEDLSTVIDRKRDSFRYDLVQWRNSGYQGAPAPIATSARYELEFYLAPTQQQTLQKQLDQFRSSNPNLTLRKMSEEIGAEVFFYKVRPQEKTRDSRGNDER